MTMRVRAVIVTELPPAAVIAPYADWCLEHGEDFRYGELMLAPDTLMAEWLANGHELPTTMTLTRHDGRSVSVYAIVGDLGYPLRPRDDA